MNDNSFKMCIDCANKQSRVDLAKGTYYCPLVKEILPNGIVHYDTDAIVDSNRKVYHYNN